MELAVSLFTLLHSAMKRLTRLGWLYTEAPVYFITTCPEKRRKLLANPSSHSIFREFCEAAGERGASVGRYVLMPDHFHLFGCIPHGPLKLAEWMKSLDFRLDFCYLDFNSSTMALPIASPTFI